MLPLCYQMASVHQRTNSKYWYCIFRVQEIDPSTGEYRWKQIKRNTRQTDRKKAERAADEIEATTLAEYGSGDEKSKKMLVVLKLATEQAMKGVLTETLARKFLTEIFSVAHGSELKTYTTREWFAEWLDRKKRTVKDSTFSLYRLACDVFLKWLGERADLRIETVATPDVRQWRDKLHDEGRTGKTVGQYQKSVSSAFRAAVAEGVLLRNPAEGLDFLPKEDSVKREPFTLEEVKALVENSNADWALAISLGFYTGLRLRDIANLKWADVDLTSKLIEVEPMKQARKKEHKKKLHIPMHPKVVDSFLQFSSSDDEGSFVFPKLAGKATGGTGGLSWHFTQIMDAAGVDPMIMRTRKKGEAGRQVSARGFHSLRHSFVSALANLDVNPELRKKLSGHSDSESHKIYTHLDQERLRSAVEKIPII